MGIAVSGSSRYYGYHENAAGHDLRHSPRVHLRPPHRERRADSRGDAADTAWQLPGFRGPHDGSYQVAWCRGAVCQRLYLRARSEEHTSELQSLRHLVCRLLLEKKKIKT